VLTKVQVHYRKPPTTMIADVDAPTVVRTTLVKIEHPTSSATAFSWLKARRRLAASIGKARCNRGGKPARRVGISN